MKLAYLGKSSVDAGPYRSTVHFAPNLGRERVWFDGELRDPIRFREVISALHEVVVGDLRFRKRDKTAYRAWLEANTRRENELREQLASAAYAREMEERTKSPPPADLEPRFREAHRRYWKARVKWANELMKHDPELFRHLVPCDPVVTVAPDAVLFEGFAKDESSYGCVIVDRNSIVGKHEGILGTTNVDYSIALYDHFQTLRTYRQTRLHVDPEGFEVAVEGRPDYREEKIDLPPSWLRGFGQISAATALPSRTVELPVAVMYSILAFLKRHREKASPRSLRFELAPGKPPSVVIEPWGERIVSHGPPYRGERPEVIKVWGRRRLFALTRVLPLADRFEVHLLGSGLPSIWVARMGEIQLVLGLSGWTTNDWSSGAALDLLAGTWEVDDETLHRARGLLARERAVTLDEIIAHTRAPRARVIGALHRLAQRGQCVYDFGAGRYRYRQILDEELGESLLGPEPPELTRGRQLFVAKKVKLGETAAIAGKRLVTATVDGAKCEAIFDGDGVMTRAKCVCVFHRSFGIRKGPCRHLIALRLQVRGADLAASQTDTFASKPS